MELSLEQIRHTADRVAASHGLDVVDVEYLGPPKHRVLRIFIEKNREERARLAAGQKTEELQADSKDYHSISRPPVALDQLAWVTHEDCERFSRDFGTLLDVEDLVPGNAYTLEVSSPGLDRKLTALADYGRFLGSLVKVQTISPVAGNRHWQGRLTEVKAGGILLDPTAVRQRNRKRTAAEQTVEIAFANIEKANLVPEF